MKHWIRTLNLHGSKITETHTRYTSGIDTIKIFEILIAPVPPVYNYHLQNLKMHCE